MENIKGSNTVKDEVIAKSQKESDKGRVALVTGGSRGIGRAICLKLAQEEKAIAVNYKTNKKAAKQVVEEIKKTGKEALAIQADVSDSKQVTAMVKNVIKEFGGIDILVNNAGTNFSKPLTQTTDRDWYSIVNTHLSGAFFCSREVGNCMIKQKYGKIINISSMMGLMGYPEIAPYCAAKAGIIGLTKSLAKELGTKGIRVNAIVPGYIETDLTKDCKPKTIANFVDQTILGRLGKPEEIANLVCYLVSDEADYIIGETINISGGALV